MKISQIVKKVIDQKTCHVVRVTRNQPPHEPNTPYQYDAIPYFDSGKKKGWVTLDLFTASAMSAVYDALGPEMKEKYDTIFLPRLIQFCWEHIK